jgi:hypothetical protein
MKKILIIGNGFVAKKFYIFFKKDRYKVNIHKINRIKSKNIELIEKFYHNEILNTIRDFSFDVVINCSGSTESKSIVDNFFNRRFDILFQQILDKKKIKTLYININSSVFFYKYSINQSYSDSKKYNFLNFKNSKYYLTIAPNYIYNKDDKNNKLINNYIKLFPIIFIPRKGKTLYPIKIKKFYLFIVSLLNKKDLDCFKYILLGKKIYLSDLIKKKLKKIYPNKKIISFQISDNIAYFLNKFFNLFILRNMLHMVNNDLILNKIFLKKKKIKIIRL